MPKDSKKTKTEAEKAEKAARKASKEAAVGRKRTASTTLAGPAPMEKKMKTPTSGSDSESVQSVEGSKRPKKKRSGLSSVVNASDVAESVETPAPSGGAPKKAANKGKARVTSATRESSVSSNASGRSRGKATPTIIRMSEADKSELAQTDRVMHVALDRSEKNKQGTKFRELHSYLTSKRFTGLIRISPSGTSFYAVIFDSTENRNAALKKLKAKGGSSFKVENEDVKLTASEFGAQKSIVNHVWSITGNPLSTAENIRQIVEKHFLLAYPAGFESEIKVFEKTENGIGAGQWAVVFATPPPNDCFSKQIKVSGRTYLVSPEPTSICRYCQKPGHTIIECPDETTGKGVSLEHESGYVKGALTPEESSDEDGMDESAGPA